MRNVTNHYLLYQSSLFESFLSEIIFGVGWVDPNSMIYVPYGQSISGLMAPNEDWTLDSRLWWDTVEFYFLYSDVCFLSTKYIFTFFFYAYLEFGILPSTKKFGII